MRPSARVSSSSSSSSSSSNRLQRRLCRDGLGFYGVHACVTQLCEAGRGDVVVCCCELCVPCCARGPERCARRLEEDAERCQCRACLKEEGGGARARLLGGKCTGGEGGVSRKREVRTVPACHRVHRHCERTTACVAQARHGHACFCHYSTVLLFVHPPGPCDKVWSRRLLLGLVIVMPFRGRGTCDGLQGLVPCFPCVPAASAAPAGPPCVTNNGRCHGLAPLLLMACVG